MQPDTDSPDRFSPGSELYIDGTRTTVLSSRPHRVGYVVLLAAVPDRDTAETHNGSLLTIEEERLEDLPQNTYYHFQLIDMDVFTDEGEHLGRIVEILDTPGNDVYIVRKDGQRDTLLPAIRDVVRNVDMSSARMTVHLLPGLK